MLTRQAVLQCHHKELVECVVLRDVNRTSEGLSSLQLAP
jgi:hypothetical protein